MAACTLSVCTAQVSDCSAGPPSKADIVFCALPRSKQLRQPAAWLAHCSRWAVHLNHLPRPSCLVSRVHCKSTVSGVPCVSSGELISGCKAPVNCSGSQEDLVSNWEPAYSLVEDAISGGKISPCLLALAVARLPLCLWLGDGPVRSQLALLWCLLSQSFVL